MKKKHHVPRFRLERRYYQMLGGYLAGELNKQVIFLGAKVAVRKDLKKAGERCVSVANRKS
ncbi:MAG: hypothetical protein HQ517_04355 [SAR324 cluster bacterium]|nr:hypothetical protein [SAR324 cluster bacterium]